MRSRLRVLEGLSRLEGGSELEAWTAVQNIRGWETQWLDTLPAEDRLAMFEASFQWWQLQGQTGADAEAIIVEAWFRRYGEAERAYVAERVRDHLAVTPPADRPRWAALYLGADPTGVDV